MYTCTVSPTLKPWRGSGVGGNSMSVIKTLQRQCNKVRDIAQLTQAQQRHRHWREHMFRPLLQGSQTFLHRRHLLFDPDNVLNKGEKRVVEKQGERRLNTDTQQATHHLPSCFRLFLSYTYPPNRFQLSSTHTMPLFQRYPRINKGMFRMWTMQKHANAPPNNDFIPGPTTKTQHPAVSVCLPPIDPTLAPQFSCLGRSSNQFPNIATFPP